MKAGCAFVDMLYERVSKTTGDRVPGHAKIFLLSSAEVSNGEAIVLILFIRS